MGTALRHQPPNGNLEGSVTCTRNGEEWPDALAFSSASRALFASPTSRLPSTATQRPTYSGQWCITHSCSFVPGGVPSTLAEPGVLSAPGRDLAEALGIGTMVPNCRSRRVFFARARLVGFLSTCASPRFNTENVLTEWCVDTRIEICPSIPQQLHFKLTQQVLKPVAARLNSTVWPEHFPIKDERRRKQHTAVHLG